MNFSEKRNKIKDLLLDSGLCEVHYSKAHIPQQLPSAIVSLASRQGFTRLDMSYAEQKYRFELHIVTDDSENADDELIKLIETIDDCLQTKMQFPIDSTDFYDSMLSARNIRVAKFEVIL